MSESALRLVQQQLEGLYALEPGPDIVDYVRAGPSNMHEHLLVREADGVVELALELPDSLVVLSALTLPRKPSNDWLELIEGVSHFVCMAERARTNLPTTLLELELQAEVDKFVLLGFAAHCPELVRVLPHEARVLHRTLYEHVWYLHPPGTMLGDRYRTASDLAARFVDRLLDMPSNERVLAMLRRFHRSGQADKVWLATAA